MPIELTISGRLFTAFTVNEQIALLEDLADRLAESVRETILEGFDRSVKLAAMVGQRADQEAVRAITRSIKVEVLSFDPISLEVKFEDDYSRWYGGEELPEDVAETLQEVIDSSIQNWLLEPKSGNVVSEVLLGE